jgi:hypothetical protein
MLLQTIMMNLVGGEAMDAEWALEHIIHYRSHVPAKLMFIITTRDTAVFIIGCH